jgi:hypothetical protein
MGETAGETVGARRLGRPDWRLQVPPEPPLTTSGSVQAVLRDVGLLLDYLNRLPEAPLDPYFRPEAGPAGGATRGATPPCADKTYFLGRIAAIAARGADAKPTDTTEPPGGPPAIPAGQDTPADRDGSRLADLAFLIWSCDFLAAIARPATLDTIRVTRAYRAARMMGKVRVNGGRAAGGTADERDVFMSHYGVRIARRVGRFQFLAWFLLWFSLYLSFMVYSGQVLMHENIALQADEAAFKVRVREAVAQDEALVQAAQRTDPALGPLVLATGYCGDPPLRPDAGPELVLTTAASAGAVPSVPPTSLPPDDRPKARVFVGDHQRALCEERDKLGRRERDLKNMHGAWLRTALPVFALTAPWALIPTAHDAPRHAEDLELETHQYGMQQVVNGLLAGIMPAMYAALGALASLFRRLLWKAEYERLGPADYGGMMSSLVLGGLTGAVIGLFANIAPHSGQGAGLPLTTTALALLAGYATDRVLSMFDGLADRVFVVPEAPGGTGRRPA